MRALLYRNRYILLRSMMFLPIIPIIGKLFIPQLYSKIFIVSFLMSLPIALVLFGRKKETNASQTKKESTYSELEHEIDQSLNLLQKKKTRTFLYLVLCWIPVFLGPPTHHPIFGSWLFISLIFFVVFIATSDFEEEHALNEKIVNSVMKAIQLESLSKYSGSSRLKEFIAENLQGMKIIRMIAPQVLSRAIIIPFCYSAEVLNLFFEGAPNLTIQAIRFSISATIIAFLTFFVYLPYKKFHSNDQLVIYRKE